MSKKRNQENNITFNTYADVLCEAALPLFNYGANEHANQLSMLSLFSGCGGMDLGFEGKFICHRRSVAPDSPWIEEEVNDNWVLLRKNRFNTIFANDILPEALLTWTNYMRRFDKDATIYHLESIVDLVKAHKEGANIFPENVDIVTGGFPCQDFSVAGKRRGFESDKGHDGKVWEEDIPKASK